MAQIVLWIQLEDRINPFQHTVSNVNQNLDNLATEICATKLTKLKNVNPQSLEFYGKTKNEDKSGRPLHSRIQLKHLETSDIAPLIVRYPLSNVSVHIRYNLSTSKGSVMLPHSTGLYYNLQQEVYQKFEILRDGDPEFYFVQHLDDGSDGDDIRNEFQLNAIVKNTPTKAKNRKISLGITIEGRKAYGDYTIKEVSKLFTNEEWNHIGNAPTFDIETLPQLSFTPTKKEFKYFVKQLDDKNLIFAGKISNESIAHEFISIFMTTAIRLIQKHHLKSPKNLQLFVEEYLSGSRGYGPVNYLVKFLQLAVILNEAKHWDFDQGAAQNIVQMHSALEKLNKKHKLDHADTPFAMYGIVTTARDWIFLRWTGSLEEPIIEISKDYNCGGFTGTMENSKSILCHIIRIILSAITAVGPKPESEVIIEESVESGRVMESESRMSEHVVKKRKYK